MKLEKVKIYWSTTVGRGLTFSLIWWVITDSSRQSWWIGGPAVLLSLLASLALLPPTSLSWYHFIKFVPFFLIHSFLGAVDVAWRALHPGMPIAPALIRYPLQLPSGLPRVFMAYTITMLPGILTAELGNNYLKLHVLDETKDFLSELKAVEQHVARIFGCTISDTLEE